MIQENARMHGCTEWRNVITRPKFAFAQFAQLAFEHIALGCTWKIRKANI